MRRNHKDIKLISMLNGSSPPQRLTNVESLHLPYPISQEVEKIIYENRMYWEAWIESASSIYELMDNIRKRGYPIYPRKLSPLLRLSKIEEEKGVKWQRMVNPKL